MNTQYLFDERLYFNGLEIKLQYRWPHAQTDVCILCPMYEIWL